MKYLSRCVFLLVSMFCLCGTSLAYDLWEIVYGIKEAGLKEAAVSPYKEGIVYVASDKRLYRTEDNGKSWQAVFSAKGNEDAINFIKVSDQAVFVCTKKGLFKSNNGKTKWENIFEGMGIEENNAQHIAMADNNIIYLGTQGGLFISNNNGSTWTKDTGNAGSNSIKWISFADEEVFIATEIGVYKKQGSGWKRVFVAAAEEADYDSEISDEAIASERPVNSMLVKGEKIFLATDNGIFTSAVKDIKWNRFSSNGLISSKVKRLLFEENMFAVTDKGIFILKDNAWESIYKGMSADKTNALSRDRNGIIWAATEMGLYKLRIKSDPLLVKRLDIMEGEDDDVLSMFEHEPSIRETQNIAIKYAEVHPEKIQSWRKAAKQKAILPDVSIGMDRSVTDLYHWEGGSTSIINDDFLRKGKPSIEWDVSLTWDLGDLIWSDDQTSIDVRSKLMVQLRDDILDEVTRTYFERRRLQVEMYLSPPSEVKEKIENKLRIQELTSDLDALTGGYFSKVIE